MWIGYGTTKIGYGTANTDAGVGIGLLRGIQKIDKKGYELADKAINYPKVILVNRK